MLLVKRFSPLSSKDTMHPKTDRLHGSTSGYMALPSSVSKTLPFSHVKVQKSEKRTSLARYERLNILEKDRRLEADMKMKKIMQQASAELLKTTKRISRGDRVDAKPSSFVEKTPGWFSAPLLFLNFLLNIFAAIVMTLLEVIWAIVWAITWGL
jgi:hypothetical protein